MTSPVIDIQDLRRSYPMAEGELEILKGLTLQINPGEFVAIMGPSGSGKSTLLQILGLLDRPTSGIYKFFGQDVSRLSDDEGAALRAKTIGFVFQMFNLLSRTSALKNIMLPMIYTGVPQREARATQLLKDVGLGDRSSHKPNQLSGGQQQRVAIARALANRPQVIFADEPTGNLASDQARDILQLLMELNRSGITLIMVTHEADIAEKAQRILRLKDGRIVEDERRTTSLPLSPPPRETPTKPSAFHWWTEMSEFATSAFQALQANKVRSLLSMLGILIGVAAVIAMLALGRGAQKAIETRLSSLGSNLLMLMPGAPTQGGVRGEAGASSRLTMDDVKALARINPHIRRVDGNISGSVRVAFEDRNVNTQLTGALPIYQQVRNATPYWGRFFTEEDNDSRARVVLLGQTVVNTLFNQVNPVGQEVKMNRVHFRVIGVLPMKGATGFRDQDDMVLVPLRTAMDRVLGRKYLSQIFIECDSPSSMALVMGDIRTLMRKRHRLPEYKEDDFTLRNMAELQETLASTTRTFTVLLGIVAAISLMVGGIGIMNIMLVSVTERTREIGLRKAVGAARRAILSQFLIESATLALLGGASGVALGAGIAFTFSKLAGWAAEVAPGAVALSFLFSAGVGILFGFWPARKASLLSPIEALRYE